MEMEESWAHLARLRNSGPARNKRRHPHRLLPRTLHSDQVDSADLGKSTNERAAFDQGRSAYQVVSRTLWWNYSMKFQLESIIIATIGLIFTTLHGFALFPTWLVFLPVGCWGRTRNRPSNCPRSHFHSWIFITAYGLCINRLLQIAVLAGWTVAIATGSAVIYGLTAYVKPGSEFPAAAQQSYGSMFRLAWAVAVAWVIFACCTGYGGNARSRSMNFKWFKLRARFRQQHPLVERIRTAQPFRLLHLPDPPAVHWRLLLPRS